MPTWTNITVNYLLLVILFGSRYVVSLSNSTNVTFASACENGLNYPAVYIEQQPLIFREDVKDGSQVKGIIQEILEKAIQECCSKYTGVSYQRKGSFRSIGDVLHEHRTELVLPVGRRAGNTHSVLDRHFVVLLESPGLAVIVKKGLSGADLALAVFQSWPIVIFILMSLALAGVFVWFLDHGVNPDEFPDFFPRGVFEGFWWASVTMTTVGYGDKVPKSVLGRLFAVVWINVGLIIVAIFMGIVTTSLTTTSSKDVGNLYGLPISVINGSSEYQIAILYNTQIYAKSNYEAIYKSISEGETQLALIDVYSVSRHQEQFSKYRLEVAAVMSEPIYYGAVITSGEGKGLSCVSRYHENHEDEIHHVLERYLIIGHTEEQAEVPGLGYFDGSVFGYTIYVMAGMFAIVLVCGLVWQYKLRDSDTQQGSQQTSQPIEIVSEANYLDQPLPRTETTKHFDVIGQAEPSIVTDHSQSDRKLATERMLVQQSAELLRMDEDMTAFKKSWEMKFRAMQGKHKRQQIEIFQLDNEGYEIT